DVLPRQKKNGGWTFPTLYERIAPRLTHNPFVVTPPVATEVIKPSTAAKVTVGKFTDSSRVILQLLGELKLIGADGIPKTDNASLDEFCQVADQRGIKTPESENWPRNWRRTFVSNPRLVRSYIRSLVTRAKTAGLV